MKGDAETEGFVSSPKTVDSKGFHRWYYKDSPNYEPNKLVSIDTI